ncbi:MAG: hypothetical protein ACRCWJ_12915 [Casimicrobium sp.]
MNIKHKSLVAALMGAGALAVAGSANAVYLNSDGTGELLIYPYYTVRNNVDTLISVVNSTNQGKAVKIRFREGKNSADVLDFNLYLSPQDVWTGSVSSIGDNGNGTGGARLKTGDTTCVFPLEDEFGNKVRENGFPFRNFGFVQGNADGGPTDVDRVREGYVEIFEMATIPSGTALYDDIEHNNGNSTTARTPDCKIVNAGNAIGSASVLGTRPPSGGLFGNATTISFTQGTNTGIDAIAFNDFWAGNSNGDIASPAAETPSLNDGGTISVVTDNNVTYVTDWGASILAVGATIMHSNIMNEYAYTADNVFATDWVITMPTKRQHVNGALAPIPPFQRKFTKDGACDDVRLVSYDREEGRSQSRIGLSPPPPTGTDSLCWESNVISFGGLNSGASKVYGSTNALGFNGYQNGGFAVPTVSAAPQGEGGWLDMSFVTTGVTNNHTMVGLLTQRITITGSNAVVDTVSNVTFRGLPTVGFAITQGNAGQRASFASSYGHRYRKSITPGAITTAP